jgi:hypothetical protein
MTEKWTLWNIIWDNFEVWCQYQQASHVWLYCTYQCYWHTRLTYVMSRSTAVRVLMVLVRSYRNTILILTVIITSNPTLPTLFNRYSFWLWDTMLKTSVCFKLWKLIYIFCRWALRIFCEKKARIWKPSLDRKAKLHYFQFIGCVLFCNILLYVSN